MECCEDALISVKTVPRYVKPRNKYRIFCISAALLLVLQLSILVYSIMCQRNRNHEICSESDSSIWIPRKNFEIHEHTSADKSQFYCPTLKQKLTHLIDFLVVANRSKVQGSDNKLRAMNTDTSRPVTKILHLHPINGPRFTNKFYLKDWNEVKVFGDGSVRIEQDGIYCVYGIVTFVHAPRDVPNDKYQIDRTRHNHRTVILSDTINQTKHLQVESYKTIDLSGNFLLRKGDVLNPVVRNISAVYSFSPANYWGVFQVKPETHSK